MKRKHYLLKEKDNTRDAVAQIAGWCLIVALHQRFGVGKDRINRVAAAASNLEKEVGAIIDEYGRAEAIRELQRRLDGICATEMRVPLNRNTKSRREVELRVAADQSMTLVWCIFALSVREALGFGPDRLNKLHKETVENYRQVNEMSMGGTQYDRKYAFGKLAHCAEQATGEKINVVQESDDYDKRAFLWEQQIDDYIKAGTHKVRAEMKRRDSVNKLATNVLSDAARQQAALKVQQDFFGGGYR